MLQEIVNRELNVDETTAYICHGRKTLELMWPRPYEIAAATMVARPFVLYHAAIRMGCSARLYHWLVMMLNSGRQPASNRPKKKRAAIREPKLWQAAIDAWAMPHPRQRHGIRIRWGTLTIKMDEKGCQAS